MHVFTITCLIHNEDFLSKKYILKNLYPSNGDFIILLILVIVLNMMCLSLEPYHIVIE